MINIYDKARKKVAILENAFSITESKRINEIYQFTFSLPASDVKNKHCEAFSLVRFESKNNTSDFYRIISKDETRADNNVIKYTCEHVISLLIDSALPTQSTSLNTKKTIEKILSYQTDWTLGRCDFNFSYEYYFEKENLLSALFAIPEVFSDVYYFDYDTNVFPYSLSLKKVDLTAHPDIYIRKELNRVKATRSLDYSSIITKIKGYGQGEGINQLQTDDIYADAEHLKKYGIREKIVTDRRFTNKDTLTAYCRSILLANQDPILTYSATLINRGLE